MTSINIHQEYELNSDVVLPMRNKLIDRPSEMGLDEVIVLASTWARATSGHFDLPHDGNRNMRSLVSASDLLVRVFSRSVGFLGCAAESLVAVARNLCPRQRLRSYERI